MLVRSATTRECERLFRREVERRGHRFGQYKKKWQPSRAALAVTQAKSNQAGGTACTVPITTTAGHLLVIAAYQGVNNTSTLAITDSSGANTWTQVGSYGSASAASRMAMFYSLSTSGVTTVTATWSGTIAATIAATVYEISGQSTGGLDPNSSNPGVTNASASLASLASASISSTNPAAIFLYAVGEGTTSTGWAGTASFAFPTGSFLAGGGRMGIGNLIVASPQSALTTTTSWTSAGNDRIGIIAAFSAAMTFGPEDDSYMPPKPADQEQIVSVF